MSDIVELLRTRNGNSVGFGLGPVCDEAAAEIERLRVDAARYRWLRDDPPLNLAVRRFPGETERGCYLDGSNLDAAIDAAMIPPVSANG